MTRLIMIINTTVELMHKSRYDDIDTLLKDAHGAEVLEMVSYLRTTFSIRLHLKEWNKLLDVCAVKIENEGKSKERILTGLL